MKTLLVLLALLLAVSVNAQQHVPKNAVRQISLTADTTNATTSLHGTPLQVILDSNATWHFEAHLLTGSDGAAGLATAVSIPSAATIIGEEFGTDTSANQQMSARVTASATAGRAWNEIGDSTGWVNIWGTVTTTSGTGSLMIEFKKITSGNATLQKGSWLKAIKEK